MRYSQLDQAGPKKIYTGNDGVNKLIHRIAQNKAHRIILAYTGAHTKCYVDIIYKRLVSALEDVKCVSKYLISGATVSSVKNLDIFCSGYTENTIIIAIGGGSCIDVVKLVAKRRNLRIFVFPTVLSSDCLASPVSVIMDGCTKTRLPSETPEGIYIDTSITSKAPRRLILSGMADLISNESALLDIELNIGHNSEIGFARLLSEVAINYLFLKRGVKIDDPSFQKVLAEGLILSGLSMSLAGSSITASGAEHLISHAIDYYEVGTASHGEQVYIGMLCSELIRQHFGKPTMRAGLLDLLEESGISKDILSYNIDLSDLVRAVKKASSLRLERVSILNLIDDMSVNELSKLLSSLY